MEIGVVFPQIELGAAPGAIRTFVQTTETWGYNSVFLADHVLGADRHFHHHPLLARYSSQSVVHEPLTWLAYSAAITTRLALATGVILLPQWQTAWGQASRGSRWPQPWPDASGHRGGMEY